ncbi:DUF2851 family protein [Aquimarina gracilis]|uniref:DUF2851 family protein n=1 Tax=Aquimarina gracilis TaxID=874422 RepID=A0ABU5ZYE1_9FLAO|nr:DUF2851 family protein [Aquimarina gracilis]MEB3346852.1 DUF2851 family protein [Aquimarina gracilis]
MNEDFLHYLWKHKKFELCNLKTTQEQEVVIKRVGVHNINESGPDFFNAMIAINGQKWAGNVEIHMKSSDWYTHNHENDKAYDNVILHVVWEDNVSVFRKDNTLLPALQLKDYVSKEMLLRYKELFEQSNTIWISCEKQFSKVPDFILSNWQERLFIERLEQKSILILELLKKTSNDWEAVLFKLLAKNFGLKINGDAFLSLANSLDFSIVRKCSKDLHKLEALFFGQAGFFEDGINNSYAKKLAEEYNFLKNKFKLNSVGVIRPQFFRLRPLNFPTIRLAQFANLYHTNQRLFNDIIIFNDLTKMYTLFKVGVSSFWEDHYTFNKQSVKRSKNLTDSFIDLLFINTVIPMKFVYAKNQGKNLEDQVFKLISNISRENNRLVNDFENLGAPIKNALHSQAIIQLKSKYCDQKACLQCAIGNYLLNRDQSLG